MNAYLVSDARIRGINYPAGTRFTFDGPHPDGLYHIRMKLKTGTESFRCSLKDLNYRLVESDDKD